MTAGEETKVAGATVVAAQDAVGVVELIGGPILGMAKCALRNAENLAKRAARSECPEASTRDRLSGVHA